MQTFGPQSLPWLLMFLAPRAEVTRRVMEPLWVCAAFAAVHVYIDVVGGQQPNALEELAKFGGVFDPFHGAERPFETFQDMLNNKAFVVECWSHELVWDLFVGRWLWLDAVKRDVPFARLSLLTLNFTGPLGLVQHLLICLLSGRGLPPLEFSAQDRLVLLPSADARGGESAGDVVRRLFATGAVAPNAADCAAMCAADVVWDDLCLPQPAEGRAAVYQLLQAAASDPGSLVVERVADGSRAAGFTWHRSAPGEDGRGLRGTTYVELNEEGMIAYVRIGAEPLFKPGAATAELLKAVAASSAGGRSTAEAAPASPPANLASASDLVRYLWVDAQASGNTAKEAARYFDADIYYEDLNYESPFVGQAAAADFLGEFDIPGLTFVLERQSDGDGACVFCWEVDLGIEGARRVKGISFYATSPGSGPLGAPSVTYVRDIPEPTLKPPPLQSLAGLLRPASRVFRVSAIEAAAASVPAEVEVRAE